MMLRDEFDIVTYHRLPRAYMWLVTDKAHQNKLTYPRRPSTYCDERWLWYQKVPGCPLSGTGETDGYS